MNYLCRWILAPWGCDITVVGWKKVPRRTSTSSVTSNSSSSSNVRSSSYRSLAQQGVRGYWRYETAWYSSRAWVGGCKLMFGVLRVSERRQERVGSSAMPNKLTKSVSCRGPYIRASIWTRFCDDGVVGGVPNPKTHSPFNRKYPIFPSTKVHFFRGD